MSKELEYKIKALEGTFDAMAHGSLYEVSVASELKRFEKITSPAYFKGFKQGLEDGYRGMAKTGLSMIREIKKEL